MQANLRQVLLLCSAKDLFVSMPAYGTDGLTFSKVSRSE
jgi:hypothetical protein